VVLLSKEDVQLDTTDKPDVQQNIPIDIEQLLSKYADIFASLLPALICNTPVTLGLAVVTPGSS
jgi:hypothetical protein